MPLIIDVLGTPTVTGEIAHIRATHPGGPRYEPSFPEELVNAEENLLLLCTTCHALVDRHPERYSVEELLGWKERQVVQGTGRQLSQREVADFALRLGRALTVRAEVDVIVELVDAADRRSTLPTIPPVNPAEPGIQPVGEQGHYIGVEVVNTGGVEVDVSFAGMELGVQSDRLIMYQFRKSPMSRPSTRLKVGSSDTWIASPAAIRAVLHGMNHRFPRRMRGYALLGDGTKVEGRWLPTRFLNLRMPDKPPGIRMEEGGW